MPIEVVSGEESNKVGEEEITRFFLGIFQSEISKLASSPEEFSLKKTSLEKMWSERWGGLVLSKLQNKYHYSVDWRNPELRRMLDKIKDDLFFQLENEIELRDKSATI